MCTSDTAFAARFEIDRIESVHISGVMHLSRMYKWSNTNVYIYKGYY